MLRSTAYGSVNQAVVVALDGHGKIDFANIAADAFGNALGNSIVGAIQQSEAERQLAETRADIERNTPSLVDMYDRFVQAGGDPRTFQTLLNNGNVRNALTNITSLNTIGNDFVDSRVDPGEVWGHGVDEADGTYTISTLTGEVGVRDQETFGTKTLNALSDLHSGLAQLSEVLPVDEILMAAQVAIMGPAAFALDYAKGQLTDTLVGDYVNAGINKVATLFNAGAHTTSIAQAEYFLNNGDKFASRMDQLYGMLETNPGVKDDPSFMKELIDVESSLNINTDLSRAQIGAQTLAQGILAVGATGFRRGEGPVHNAGLNTPEYKNGVDKPGNSVHSNLDGSVTYVRADGVSVTYRDGYPDFSPHMNHPSGVTEVTLPGGFDARGRRNIDYREANIQAGHPEWGSRPPENWTWHHVENSNRMQLVPFDINDEFGHRGGVSSVKRGGG